MYADAQAAQGAAAGAEAPGPDAGAGAKAADDDVVDAEIVDEDRKDGAA
jgi:molecular chaperone DnaK